MTRLLSVLCCAALLGACSSTSVEPTRSTSMSNLIIAEPMDVGYRNELYIARLSELLARTDLAADQQAQILYDRGVIYDRVGLRGLARFDFKRAISLKPNMPHVFNHLGIYYTQNMNFMQAYESFDSALDLDPEFEYAYLNRGIALYYGGRNNLAIEDLQKFSSMRKDDPYRAIWLFLAQSEQSPTTAHQTLSEARSHMDPNSWATQIIDLYLGNLSEAAFIDNLPNGVASRQELIDRLCEGYFYLGKLHQLNNMEGTASNFFKLALSTNHYSFVEHRYARLELELIREKAYAEKAGSPE